MLGVPVHPEAKVQVPVEAEVVEMKEPHHHVPEVEIMKVAAHAVEAVEMNSAQHVFLQIPELLQEKPEELLLLKTEVSD